MRRALFWTGVALTIALVAFGIWYYVHDDYPFQLTPSEITGLSYRSVTTGGAVSGFIARPPAELADWISSMEKDSSDEPVPVTTVVTVVRSDGPSLLLYVGGARGYGRWLYADGAETAAVGVQIDQALLWYLRGVGDALAAGGHAVTPRPTPQASGASPATSPATSPSAASTSSTSPVPSASPSPTRTP
jgi:hypothetical protein